MRRSLVTAVVAGAVLFAGCGSGPPQLPVNASGAGASNEMASADMAMRVANVRYELADGVKADKDKQDAYKLGSASKSDAERLAEAFGISGDVKADEGGWNIGATGEEPAAPNTKGNRSLYLSKNGSWNMNGEYPSSSGVACAEARRAEEIAPDAPADQPVEECAPATTTTLPPNMPSQAEARSIAERTLRAAGIDVGDMKPTVEQFDQLISVRYQPVFEGQTVEGFEYGVTVNSERGIAYANGYVGDMKSVGSYDLATLDRAVERLNAQQAYPAGDDFRTMTADADSGREPGFATDADTGAPANEEPTVIKLTGVKVGLMMTFEDNGGALWLTPAYVFTTDDHGTVLANAADDKYLPPPTTAPPSDGTEPGGSEPPAPAPSDGGGNSSGGSSGSGAPPNSGQSVDPVPPSSNCARTEAPILAEVCTSASSYKAGDTVVFLIHASDPDRAFTQGPCGDGVSAEYGDDGEGDVRCLACSTDVPAGSGKVDVERKHIYAKAGTFTAKFTIKSGAECGEAHPNDSTVTLSLPVRVQ